ncbi:hypothetical protein [Methanomethylovorans sp.]|uniref:hypothetical protein n=1 Tax=Methanomethylovorans sp. TaxID=2758717 RepID=UPI003D0E7A4E
MDITQLKNDLLFFIISVIVYTILGYLSNNAINEIISGIFVGIGFVIGKEVILQNIS